MKKVKIKKFLVHDEIYKMVKDYIIFEDEEYYYFTQEYFENNYYYYFMYFSFGYDVESIKFDDNNKVIVKDLKFIGFYESKKQLDNIGDNLTSSELKRVEKIFSLKNKEDV